MRSRVSTLINGLSRRARETVVCDTPATWAISAIETSRRCKAHLSLRHARASQSSLAHPLSNAHVCIKIWFLIPQKLCTRVQISVPDGRGFCQGFCSLDSCKVLAISQNLFCFSCMVSAATRSCFIFQKAVGASFICQGKGPDSISGETLCRKRNMDILSCSCSAVASSSRFCWQPAGKGELLLRLEATGRVPTIRETRGRSRATAHRRRIPLPLLTRQRR